ncbi:hypothetical protein GOV04_05580 [Candidatus Woesearchaeota archaeon]|nr:hypothetical protein [Candidatus Woesearchaeota archaeon]
MALLGFGKKKNSTIDSTTPEAAPPPPPEPEDTDIDKLQADFSKISNDEGADTGLNSAPDLNFDLPPLPDLGGDTKTVDKPKPKGPSLDIDLPPAPDSTSMPKTEVSTPDIKPVDLEMPPEPPSSKPPAKLEPQKPSSDKELPPLPTELPSAPQKTEVSTINTAPLPEPDAIDAVLSGKPVEKKEKEELKVPALPQKLPEPPKATPILKPKPKKKGLFAKKVVPQKPVVVGAIESETGALDQIMGGLKEKQPVIATPVQSIVTPPKLPSLKEPAPVVPSLKTEATKLPAPTVKPVSLENPPERLPPIEDLGITKEELEHARTMITQKLSSTKTTGFGPPKPSPLYVKLESYKSLDSDLQFLSAKLDDANKLIAKSKRTLADKEAQFRQWSSMIEEIQRKLLYVDKKIFGES